MLRTLNRRGVLTGFGILVLASIFCFFYFDLGLLFSEAPAGPFENIQFQMNKAKIPGASIALLKGDETVFSKGFGTADFSQKRQVDSETIFTVASVSKPVTAAALMRLYDRSKFKLDDDVNIYLPFSVRNQRFPGTSITFRMLLAHTSSIQDAPIYNGSYSLNTPGQPEDSPVKLGEFLRDYLPVSGRYYNGDKNYTGEKPGSKFQYSNVAYGLIGYLVERISRESFDTYCQREVFDPLGMNSTKWFYRDVARARTARPYSYNWFTRQYDSVGFYGFPTYPDGGLKTTSGDYARFVGIFLHTGNTVEGKSFLKPKTIQEMLTVQYPKADEPYGIGWLKDDEGFSHSGADPGEFSFVYFNPRSQSAIIILTNGDSGDPALLMLTAKGFVESIAKSLAPLVQDL